MSPITCRMNLLFVFSRLIFANLNGNFWNMKIKFLLVTDRWKVTSFSQAWNIWSFTYLQESFIEVNHLGTLCNIAEFEFEKLYFIHSNEYTNFNIYQQAGLPRWLSGKEFSCQCRRHRRLRFDPWVRKMPWSGKWQPISVFLPGKSCGQRNVMGYRPWAQKELDTA